MTCCRCKLDLPESQFHKKGAGYQKMCKQCRKAYIRTHYQNNKSRYHKQTTQTKQRNVEFVRKIKGNTPCSDCKVQYPYWIMDFDHVKDKEFNLHSARTKGINQIKAEIAKCDIVCANCHRNRTYQRMIRVGVEPTT